MKQVQFEVETDTDNLTLGLCLPKNLNVVFKGMKIWNIDHYDYILTGWDIFYKDEWSKGSPGMMDMLFEGGLAEARQEMIKLHEAEESPEERSNEQADYFHKLYKEMKIV